jgi:hypothetical protein
MIHFPRSPTIPTFNDCQRGRNRREEAAALRARYGIGSADA